MKLELNDLFIITYNGYGKTKVYPKIFTKYDEALRFSDGLPNAEIHPNNYIKT